MSPAGFEKPLGLGFSAVLIVPFLAMFLPRLPLLMELQEGRF